MAGASTPRGGNDETSAGIAPPSVGQRLSHYHLRQILGAGGMGVVYQAWDEHLDRDVAVKVLRPGTLTDERARRRFRKEALLLSKLSHPSIAVIHDFDSQSGVDFLVMEHIPGTTLHCMLMRGALPEAEALRLGVQLAEGLAVAHNVGILHRDLKPTNLRVMPDGRLKILDFGLALFRQPSSDAAAAETPTQGLLGTPAYMSPEQLMEQPATRQSDIFSFGIVLYEMLSGAHPFRRKSTIETAEAILRETEPSLSRYRELPELLEHVLKKMLAKDPKLRYQSVHEVHTDLTRLLEPIGGTSIAPPPTAQRKRSRLRRPHDWALGVVGAGVVVVALVGGVFTGLRHADKPETGAPRSEASVAVLPFADMSSGGDLEYFCDGITEQIISSLTEVEGLRVTARTSAFAFKGRNVDAREIGQRLGAKQLVEGSMRKVGDRLRVTVQLVNTSDGFQVWSKSYDPDLADALEVQEEIARDVARALEIGLAGAPWALPATRATVDPEAYHLYLRGRFLWNKRTPESLAAAIGYFEQALARDPRFALAHVGLADAYTLLGVYGNMRPAEARTKARAAVAKALALDDTLAEAHASFGLLQAMEWNWAAAEDEYRRALELKPGYATARCWYALLLVERGQADEALVQIRHARDLDPLSPYVNVAYGTTLYLARRYDEAARQLETTLEMNPESTPAYETLAYVYAAGGAPERALQAARRGADLAGGPTPGLGYVLASSGKAQEARVVLDTLVHLWEQGSGSPGRIAVVYAGLGNRDRALEWLEKACREHDAWIAQLKVDPLFDGLRSDPRFGELLRKVGLEQSPQEEH